MIKRFQNLTYQNFQFFGIWSVPNAAFVCIEPWFNTADKTVETGYFKDKEGIMTLKPEQEFDCKYKIKFFQ